MTLTKREMLEAHLHAVHTPDETIHAVLKLFDQAVSEAIEEGREDGLIDGHEWGFRDGFTEGMED